MSKPAEPGRGQPAECAALSADGAPAPDVAAGLAAALDESGNIAISVLCRDCGYNLRGLRPDARCPECGAAVTKSVHGDLLCFADPAWLQRLRRGGRLVAYGVLWLVIAWLLMVGLDILWEPLDGLAKSASVVLLISRLAAHFAAFYGVWLCTSRDPSRPSTGRRVPVRMLARTAILLSAAAVPLGRMVSHPSAWTLLQGPSLATTFVALLAAACPVAYVWHLEGLAERISDDKVKRFTRSLLCVLLGLCGISVVTGYLGTIHHGGMYAASVLYPGMLSPVLLPLSCTALLLTAIAVLLLLYVQFRFNAAINRQVALVAVSANGAAGSVAKPGLTGALDESGNTTATASCRRCGHNLRSLKPDARCPECGAANGASAQGDLLRFADPAWLGRLRRGGRLLAGGLLWLIVFPLLLLLLLLLLLAENTFDYLPDPLWTLGMGLYAALMLSVVPAVLAVSYGTWLGTTREPNGVGESDRPIERRLTRMAVLVFCACMIIAVFACWWYGPRALAEWWLVLATVALVVVAAGALPYVRYIGKLAGRIPDREIKQSTRILLFVLLGACVAAAAATCSKATLAALRVARDNLDGALLLSAADTGACAAVFLIGVAALLLLYVQFSLNAALKKQGDLARAAKPAEDEPTAAE
jgi:predicted Zn-ribbon and HTH transcriptional regulator